MQFESEYIDFPCVRSKLDLLYKAQLFRGLNFSGYFKGDDRQLQLNKIVIAFEGIGDSSYINTFHDISSKSGHLNLEVFLEYTNLIVTPILQEIENALIKHPNIQKTGNHINIVKIIEQLSFKRGTAIMFYNNESSNMVNLSQLVFQPYSDLLFNIFPFVSRYTYNPQENTNYFEQFTNYIALLIHLEKELFNQLSEEYNHLHTINENDYLLLKKSLKYNLNDQDIVYLASNGRFISLNKKEILDLQTDKNDLYICVKGSLKTSLIDNKGNEVILDLFDEGEIFYSSFFFNDINIYSLHQGTSVFCIPEETFSKIMFANYSLNSMFYENLINCIIKKNLYIENIISKEVKERLASLLLDFKLNNKAFNFSKYNSARYLNMRAETFSRALRELEKEEKKDKEYLCKYCSKYQSSKCLINGELPNKKKCIHLQD